MDLFEIKEKIVGKKRYIINILASLIVLLLITALVLTIYPQFFDFYSEPWIYAAIVLVSFVLINILLWFEVELINKFKKKGKKKEVKVSDEEEIKAVLEVVDDLLGKLPEKEIDEFMKTKDAELYKKILKKYGIK